MDEHILKSYIGREIILPGHLDSPVVLDEIRLLGSGDSATYECRVRILNSTLVEANP